MSIYWHLAMRGNVEAQSRLASLLTFYEPNELPKNRILANRWARKAAASQAYSSARYNLAVVCRNRGNMEGYRYWLARDRQDPSSRHELKAFKVRFPYAIMRRWHRYARER